MSERERERRGRTRTGEEAFSKANAYVQLKPVQETNLHFLYFVVFFRLLKRKNFKKRKLQKKNILVHEIKIFFYKSVLTRVALLGNLKEKNSHRKSPKDTQSAKVVLREGVWPS